MMEWLSNLEKSILLWINQTNSNSIFDGLFPFYTDIHKNIWFSIPAVLILLYFFIHRFKRAGLTYFIFLALSIGISDFAGKNIKNNFPRMRPYTVKELQITEKSPAGPTSSFYSNHTSNMFTFATYTSQFFPAAKPLLFILAFLTGYSRMYNGVHYPSDVLVGALMGLLIGWLCARIAKKIVYKIQLSPLEKKP
ncbi:MAG: phosphatase PAP2 family protein [Bdellovibrionota bacterium]